MKALDEALTQAFIAFLEANKGDHEYDLPVGANDSEDWTVPASEWDFELLPQFMLSAELARFSTPYMLDGTNFWTQLVRAKAFQANGEGKGEMNLFNQFDFVQDPVNMTAVAPNKTFMVNSSAVAFLSGNYFGSAPMTHAGNHRMWKIPSKNLPGVFYDVHELETCVSNDFIVSYKIKANFDFFLNPLGCDESRTGILAFEREPGV
jgi:hypothetical protein